MAREDGGREEYGGKERGGVRGGEGGRGRREREERGKGEGRGRGGGGREGGGEDSFQVVSTIYYLSLANQSYFSRVVIRLAWSQLFTSRKLVL